MVALWTRSGKRGIVAEEGCHGERCIEPPSYNCAYVDQWGWHCLVPFCAGHGLLLGVHPFCMQHAALCLGLGGDSPALSGELDDAYEQLPSMITWVARGIDAEVRRLFADVFVADRVHFEQRVEARQKPRWLAEWSAHGVAVAIVIEGDGDPLLTISDRGVLLLCDPPDWLRHHRYQLETAQADEAKLSASMFKLVATTLQHISLMRGDVPIELGGISTPRQERYAAPVRPAEPSEMAFTDSPSPS